ncbi:MAG TPA: Rrf2 family transcriptional regulator [Verrucomicrobiales bacterium]|nr:Rrf2 family transcriptional regulator [Verrucomicrobiales bacterium]
MQLTTYTDYALRTLIYLVPRPGETVSTREIADHYGISLNHLVKVAKFLTNEGWLISTRGIGGGISLAPHTVAAKVGDIVRCTENTDLVECFHLPTNTCPIHRACRLKPILLQARQAFFEVLDSYSVRDLARSAGELKALRPPPGKQPDVRVNR